MFLFRSDRERTLAYAIRKDIRVASKDLYGAQSFIRDRKGKLTLGRCYSCKDADEARRMAEGRVAGGYAAGATAFLRRGGGEYDEGEAITIAAFGVVPHEARDALPF